MWAAYNISEFSSMYIIDTETGIYLILHYSVAYYVITLHWSLEFTKAEKTVIVGKMQMWTPLVLRMSFGVGVPQPCIFGSISTKLFYWFWLYIWSFICPYSAFPLAIDVWKDLFCYPSKNAVAQFRYFLLL